MKKIFQWFIKMKKIIMITGHRIQAGWTRHRLQCLIQRKQHQPSGLADLDRFTIRKNLKTGNIELLFLDGNKH